MDYLISTPIALLTLGQPIPFIARRFEEWEDEFPNLHNFVDSVIKAIKPPHPHLFCVQGFQVSDAARTSILSCVSLF